jgi:hypothetical protein
MQDLHLTYRYSYALHPDRARAAGAPAGLRLIVHDAHRALRNAAAIADVLDVPSAAAAQAIGRIEHAIDAGEIAEPWRAPAMTDGDAAILQALAAQVIAACDQALDREGRPTGPLGRRVADEIACNADAPRDGVFAYGGDGAVDLRGPRMTLGDVLAALGDAIALIGFARAHQLDVLMCPAVWGATEIEPEWLS